MAAPLSPMLLGRLSVEKDRMEGLWFISEKYDGWRMLYDASTDTYYSRSGEIIEVPPKMRTEMLRLNPEGYNLDGELFLGYGRFSDIRGALNAQSKDLTFRVFDLVEFKISFQERLTKLKKMFKAEAVSAAAPIRLVEQTRMQSLEDARIKMREVVARGGEGVVLRSADGLYVAGQRSSNVLKLKPVDVDEVEIIGYHCTTNASRENAAGYVSSLVCKLLDGTEKTFKVTYKSFAPPPIGTLVRVQYQSVTSTGLPRFPVLLPTKTTVDAAAADVDAADVKPSSKPAPKKKIAEKKIAKNENLKVQTLEEWEEKGGYELLPGEAVCVASATDPTKVYTVKCAAQDPLSIYCSCEAWKYQRLNPRVRTCKHCIAVCGALAEKRRVTLATLQLLDSGKNYKI